MSRGAIFLAALFSCGSGTGASSTALVQLDECPFSADAGNGVLSTFSLRASMGPCDQDHAICPIRAFATCPDGVGTEDRVWICECSAETWQCDIEGRKTWQCPPVDGGSAR